MRRRNEMCRGGGRSFPFEEVSSAAGLQQQQLLLSRFCCYFLLLLLLLVLLLMLPLLPPLLPMLLLLVAAAGLSAFSALAAETSRLADSSLSASEQAQVLRSLARCFFRQEEEARKERIFSPRQLKMGLDLEALAAQVKQKKDHERAEKEKNAAAGPLRLAACTPQRELPIHLSGSRSNALAQETRAAAGPSSLLVFEGEDPTFVYRTKKQQRQQREALQEHLFQQALMQQKENERASQYAEAAALSSRAAEAVHQRQAEERRQRDAANKEKEEEAESREIENNLRDPFLAEGRQDLIKGDSSLSPSLPRAPTGCLGANRDGFKGFPLEVREATEATNAERRQETLEREKEEERVNQQWASYAETQRRGLPDGKQAAFEKRLKVKIASSSNSSLAEKGGGEALRDPPTGSPPQRQQQQ
ncbi:hypothetical protein Emed_006078 [Eimeria media]